MRVYSADWVLPIEGAPVERGGVALDGGRIARVGPADDLDGERLHFDGSVIIPGFVNAHSHLEYAVYGGFGDGLPFGQWIALHIERKMRIGWDEHVASARLGAGECLASGITTVGDASFSGAAAQAASDLGVRAVVYLEIFGSEPAQALDRFDELHRQLEPLKSDRLVLGISPHAPYTASPELYRAAYELGLPVTTHVSESDDELEYMVHGRGPLAAISDVEPPGTTSVRHLAREKLLEAGILAVHCVTVDEEEIGLLCRNGVAVAHCPRSNAALGCGVAPLVELVAAGVPVGLGTDSPASAPSFDMFEEMRVALWSARATGGQPEALSVAQALELATLGGARALGLETEIGSLVPGKRGDLAVVSFAGSPYLPWEDPTVAVVLGGSPSRVLLSLVDGEARYEKGGFGWLELRREAAAARAGMLAGPPRSPARDPVAQKT